MPDDRVRIDPQFEPSSSRERRDRLLWLAGISALAAAAFLLGWLIRTPTPLEPEAWDPIRSTTTTAATASATTSTTTSTTVPELAQMTGLSTSLGHAVPGFTDTITLHVWVDDDEAPTLSILRWQPGERDPEAVISFRHDDDYGKDGWFSGMDVTGTWYALDDPDGTLSVRPVAAEAEGDAWMQPDREAVGIRVSGFSWHDTEAGRLAWVSCPRSPVAEATLFTLDITDRTAEPLPVTTLQDECDGAPGFGGRFGGPWIESWGDWGFAIATEGGSREQDPWSTSTILFDPEGRELARLENEPDGPHVVAGGPAGVIWTAHEGERGSSFLMTPDGVGRNPVPGLADDEWVDGAWWSPDGSLIALARAREGADRPSIRVVDHATGETLAETDEQGWPTCWSTDGRFLLYGRDPWWGESSQAELVVYDVVASAIVAEVPLPEGHHLGEIRTVDPSTLANLMTPVDWGIAPEDAAGEAGVHTVRMIVDVPYLAVDQVEDLSGRLIWDDEVVDLCNIGIRDGGPGFLHIGDIFQTTEGCGSDPGAMQDAFDAFGLPHTACVSVRSGGLDHEFCAGLG